MKATAGAPGLGEDAVDLRVRQPRDRPPAGLPAVPEQLVAEELAADDGDPRRFRMCTTAAAALQARTASPEPRRSSAVIAFAASRMPPPTGSRTVARAPPPRHRPGGARSRPPGPRCPRRRRARGDPPASGRYSSPRL